MEADEMISHARALVCAEYTSPQDHATMLAESARGANEMRPKIIAMVADCARRGVMSPRVIGAVTTLAFIDRACGMPPVRLIYSGEPVDSAGDDGA